MKKIFFYFLFLIILSLAGIFCLWSFWLSQPPLTNLKSNIFLKYPIPLAEIDSQKILMKDFLRQYDLAKQMLKTSQTLSEETIKKNLYQRMLDNQKAKLLAANYNLYISPQDLQDELLFRKSSGLENKTQDFDKILSDYGFSQEEYIDILLVPEMLQTKLTIWYYSQEKFNTSQYQLIKNIQEKLASGDDFGSLALQYSEDISSKNLKGDLGFVNINILLPEIREALKNKEQNKRFLIVSRLGLHLMEIQGAKSKNGDEEKLHLRQIFIKPTAYENWYNIETKKFTIKQYIKLYAN